MSAAIQRCTACGRRWFPERLVCPSCGKTGFVHEEADHCRIEQITTLADGSRIAAARIAGEVPVVVRLVGPAELDDSVRLTTRLDDEGPAALLPIPSHRAKAES